MPMRTIVAVGFAALSGASCRPTPARSNASAAQPTERSVFTDSALHAELCEPVDQKNWRNVCTPKDQRLELAQPQLEPLRTESRKP